MKVRPLILSLALAAPLFAQAGYSINNSALNCSAALSFANSTGLEAHCAGNFSVTGGTWTSDTKIALSADGSLTLNGVVMTAPVIDFGKVSLVNALGMTTLTGDIVIIGGELSTDVQPKPIDPQELRLPSDAATITATPGTGNGALTLEAGTTIDIGARGSSLHARGSSLQFGSLSQGRRGSVSLVVADVPDIKARLSLNGDVVLQNNAGVRFASDRTPGQLVVADNTRLVPNSTLSVDVSQRPLIWDAAAVVPEPETYALALTALATLGASAARARRRKV